MSDPIRPLIDLKISGARGESILDVVRRLALGGAPSDASDAEASLFLAIYSADATTGPPVYVSGTSFSVTGADLTRYYSVGRYIRATGTATGTIYGQVATSSYNAGLDKTTVTVTWVSGSLSNEALAVAIVEAPFATQAAYAATLAIAKALIPAGVVLTNGFAVEVAGRTAVNDGYQGAFAYKSSDTTTVFSTANDAYGFVDGQGRRFFRVFSGPSFLSWFGALDTANDYAVVMAAHDYAPEFSTIMVTGRVHFTTALAFTRRLNWICVSDKDYFCPEVTTAANAITISRESAITGDGIRLDINIFGPANSCSSALVLNNIHQSTIRYRILTGCSNFALVVAGCLINRFEQVRRTVNYTTPYDGAYGALAEPASNISMSVLNSIACNRNEFWLCIEGGDTGVVINNQGSEGNNVFRGVIEGVTGRPIVATGCYGMKVHDLHLEVDGASCQFTNCTNLVIDAVQGFSGTEGFELIGCRNFRIENCLGSINIDSTSLFGRISGHRIGAGHTLVNNSSSTEIIGGVGQDSSPDTVVDVAGTSAASENVFLNPYCDIWSAGAASAPDGWSIGAGSFARETGITYPGNPSQQSVKVTSTAVTLANCARASPGYPHLYNAEATWNALMSAVYVATGQPDVTVYLYDGAAYHGIQTVTAKDQWVPVRGGALMAVGNIVVVFTPGSVSAGTFYVGGLSLVKGTSSPQRLRDDGRRAEHIVSAVGYQPSFVGQRAYVAGTGKFYLAKDKTAAGDWIILN